MTKACYFAAPIWVYSLLSLDSTTVLPFVLPFWGWTILKMKHQMKPTSSHSLSSFMVYGVGVGQRPIRQIPNNKYEGRTVYVTSINEPSGIVISILDCCVDKFEFRTAASSFFFNHHLPFTAASSFLVCMCSFEALMRPSLKTLSWQTHLSNYRSYYEVSWSAITTRLGSTFVAVREVRNTKDVLS
jgi:hypothetical protein